MIEIINGFCFIEDINIIHQSFCGDNIHLRFLKKLRKRSRNILRCSELIDNIVIFLDKNHKDVYFFNSLLRFNFGEIKAEESILFNDGDERVNAFIFHCLYKKNCGKVERNVSLYIQYIK